MRAVVLGGGIAGLTAGLALARGGAETTILEASDRPGGLASGFRERGYTFDYFSHRLWSRDAEVLRLVESCLDEPLISCHKVSRILLDGRFYRYPIHPSDVLGGSLRTALRTLLGYASARLSVTPRGDDFRTHIVARYGEPLFESFFGPYTLKLHGCAPSELSGDLATEAVPGTGFLRQLVQRISGRTDPWDDFHYPRGGFMAIPEGLARRFTESGGRLLLGHHASRLRHRGGKIEAVEAACGARGLDLPADLVISTIPLPAVLRALDPAPDPRATKAASALKNRGMVTVYLGIRRRSLSEDHWIYVPDPAVRFNRLSETTNYCGTMAPPGRTGVCLEIACEAGDAVWRESDDRQVSRAVDDLMRIGLLRSRAEVEEAWVLRFAAVYPVYRVGYRHHLKVVERYLEHYANLEICGRQGAFWYGNTAQGIRQALDLAHRLGFAESLAA